MSYVINFCGKCGTKIENADRHFCTKCGAMLESMTEKSPLGSKDAAFSFSSMPARDPMQVMLFRRLSRALHEYIVRV